MDSAAAATLLGLDDAPACPGCGRRGAVEGACANCGVTWRPQAAPALPGAVQRVLEHPSLTARYEVVRLLGRGGMGAVYEALHRRLGKRVALKIVLGSSAEERARFEREGRILAQLSHPCLPAALDADVIEDTPVLVMELLVGRTLKAELARAGRLSLEAARAVALPVLDGLEAAHRARVIHRDLKPDNVLLLEDGRVKVLDFGLARDDGEAGQKLTRTGQVFGTPAYMAPEQWSGAPTDARSDIYAFGAMLFEMLTGQLPYRADNMASFLALHLTAPVPRLADALPGCPALLDTAITRALERIDNPDARKRLEEMKHARRLR